jgi:threonine-phosphate decarboxylase
MSFQHGGDIYSLKDKVQGEVLDFSANINPLGMPPAVSQAAQQAVLAAHHYPDPFCRELVQAIASAEGIWPQQVICGNGAADLIFRLAFACKPKKALLLAPTFSEYEEALRLAGAQVDYHFLKEENDFDLTEDIIEQLNPELDMLWLCNPNNPTGRIIDKDLMDKILEHCRKKRIKVVVDECFLDLCSQGQEHKMTGKLQEYPNLFLLRAFTKSYAMPGLRLGYGLCTDETLLEAMRGCGQPWAVSVPALAAGLAALAEQSFLSEAVAYIAQERDWLLQSLKQLNFWCCCSQANYILFRSPADLDLQAKMAQKGILIRSCSNYHGLSKEYYRVAIRQHWENQRLIQALAQCLKEAE